MKGLRKKYHITEWKNVMNVMVQEQKKEVRQKHVAHVMDLVLYKKLQEQFFGDAVTQKTCSKCNGKGKIIHEHCHKCSGNGMVRKQVELEVEIPAGVDDKNIIVLKGKGEIRKKRWTKW